MSYSPAAQAPTREFDLRGFRRRFWIVLLCAVIGAAGAYIHARRTPKKYTATAELLFGANSSVSQLLGLGNAISGQDATSTAATNVELASLPVLTSMTTTALGNKAPPGAVSVSVSAVGAGNLVDVNAKDSSPALAALVANVYAQQFIRYTKDQQSAAVSQAISALRTEIRHGGVPGTPISTLQTSLSQLEGIAAVEPVNVEIAQPAGPPPSPSSPHPISEGVLGLLIGAVVGLIIALLTDRVDPRLHSLRALASENRPVHAIPWTEGIRPTSRQSLLGMPGRSATRALRRMVQARSAHDVGGACLVILVTSPPGRGDGRVRTVASWGLARSAALASRHRGVIYVQLAEDQIGFASLLQLSDRPGWVDVLDGHVELRDAIETVRFGGGRDRPPRRIDVLLRPGTRRARGTLDDEMRFRSLIVTLTQRYGCIVLEAPPADGLDAAAFLVGDADAVVAVTRLHRSRRDATEQLVASLSAQRQGGLYVVGSVVGAGRRGSVHGADVPDLVGGDVEEAAGELYGPLAERVD